jgi:hypothetical protein
VCSTGSATRTVPCKAQRAVTPTAKQLHSKAQRRPRSGRTLGNCSREPQRGSTCLAEPSRAVHNANDADDCVRRLPQTGPEARHEVARGVSPWNYAHKRPTSPGGAALANP